MRPKILIVDDYDEIRELVGFMIESQMEAEILFEPSGFAAIKTLQNVSDIQLVISDVNMPNGSGEDVFKFLKTQDKNTPIIFLTGGDLEEHPNLGGRNLPTIPKPFSDHQVIEIVKSVLKTVVPPQQPTQYIPVRLQLAWKMHEIKTPLFVKINDSKYVAVTQEHFEFDDESLKKYADKKISHLYVEVQRAQEFISEYRKKILSDLAWEEAGQAKGAELARLNLELLRSLATQVGWSADLIHLAQEHFQRTLAIVHRNPDLHQIFHQFHKIERFGYADHCTLLFLVSSKLAYEMNIAEEDTLRKLTFAALFHDMSLTDDQFEHKEKYLKIISNREPNPNKDIKEVLAHPARAAELCRRWDFCPGLVDTIVFQHHEKPDGSGFPMGKKTEELHPLSCLFILCEDFVNYFIQYFGEPNITNFVATRSKIYTEGQFKICFDALANALTIALHKAS